MRDRQAQRLGGLVVYDQLKHRRLLYLKITVLRVLEDLCYVLCGWAEQVRIARRIGHESAILHHLTVWVHGRQPTLLSKLHDSSSFSEQKAVRYHDDRVRAHLRNRREGTLQLGNPLNLHNRFQSQAERPSRELRLFQDDWIERIGGVREHGYSGEPGDDLLEQFQSFPF